ncbi:MAG: TrmH family RNA methyltransferase [Candidatus Gracilibacteria bacterium]|jgi:tRNA G18 (ribose-2'-O)-methylase SpoU
MKKLTHEEILNIKPSVSLVKKKKRNPIYALLDNVRSMYNVGAVFRTSDGVLLKKLYLCGITAAPPRKEISKTALNADEVVPWEYCDNAVSIVKKLKKQGVKIVAVELAHGAENYSKVRYKFPVCFIFGHEIYGVSDELMKFVDESVTVPMLGRANSLNVATCYGIIVYEALNQLLNGKK